MNPIQRFLQHDGTPAGQERRPEFRHGTVLPMAWFARLFNPAKWQVGHWALFGAFLTAVADFIAFLYVSNLLGVGRLLEIEIWLLIAGVVGFISIVASIWAIWYKSARTVGIWALVFSLLFGAIPAWLVGNTILQLILNGGTLPDVQPL